MFGRHYACSLTSALPRNNNNNNNTGNHSLPRCAEFCCNGTVVDDTELGQVIQLQGDQRKNASTFLVRTP